MSLQEKIDALPPLHKEGRYVGVYGQLEPRDYQTRIDAMEARLALAREWIQQQDAHSAECGTTAIPYPLPCTCGRDALLKALEGPG